MPIAHACRACGASLSLIRAPIEPSLGLAVVVCPECRTADVRRRHPIVTWWRKRGAIRRGAVGLFGRLAVTMAMAVGCLVAAAGVLESLADVDPRALAGALGGWSPNPELLQNWREDYGHMVLAGVVAWFVLVGTILTAGLPHIRRRSLIWCGFLAVLAACTGLAAVVDWADSYRPWIEPFARASATPPVQGTVNLDHYGRVTGLATIALLVSLAGVPLGRLVLRATAARQKRAWCKALVRARRRRAHA